VAGMARYLEPELQRELLRVEAQAAEVRARARDIGKALSRMRVLARRAGRRRAGWNVSQAIEWQQLKDAAAARSRGE